eukprot:m.205148 g.205148  ORF g.205148 m.205148 type:complete len:584 (-) comp18481_c1_seq3:42-1793(-)
MRCITSRLLDLQCTASRKMSPTMSSSLIPLVMTQQRPVRTTMGSLASASTANVCAGLCVQKSSMESATWNALSKKNLVTWIRSTVRRSSCTTGRDSIRSSTGCTASLARSTAGPCTPSPTTCSCFGTQAAHSGRLRPPPRAVFLLDCARMYRRPSWQRCPGSCTMVLPTAFNPIPQLRHDVCLKKQQPQQSQQQQQQLLLQHQPHLHSSHRHQQPSVVETAGPRLRGSGPRPNQASTWTQLEPAQTALQQPPAEARRPALSSSLEPASRLFPGALSSVETGRTQQLPSHATGAAPRSPDHGYEFEGDLALALRVLGGDQAVRHVLSHRQPDQYMTKFGLDGQTLVDRVGAVLESSLPLLEKAYGSDMPRDSQQRAKWLAERWYGGLLLASDATGGRPHYLPDHLWDDPGPAQRHRQQLVGSRDVDVNRPWVQVVVCKLKNSPPTMSATNHVVKFPPLRRNTDPASRASRQVTHEVGVSLQLPADLSSHFLLLAINQHHQYIPILPSTDTLVCQQVGPFVRIVLRFHRHGDRVLQEFEVANLGVVPLKWSVRDALRPLDGWLGSPAVCFTSGAGGGGGGGGSQL